MRKDKNILHHTKQALTIFIFGLVSLSCVCCSNGDDPDGQPNYDKKTPISFNSSADPDVDITPAPLARSSSPLEDEQTSFVVYSYKNYPGDEKKLTSRLVMDGYKVFANTSPSGCSWDYTSYAGQTIHYWDYAADSYSFIAFAPFDNNHPMAFDGHTITMSDISTSYADVLDDNSLVSEPGTFSPLFAHPLNVTKADFGKTVNLDFSHVFCQVRVGFCITSEINTNINDILINQVEIKASEGQLCNGADIKITYDVVDNKLSTALSFVPKTYVDGYRFTDKEVAFTYPSAAGDKKFLSRYLRLFPSKYMGAQKKQMIFVVHINGDRHEIAMNTDLTSWEPNKAYTYIFKIDNSKGSPDVIRLYALEIQEWKYGGYAESKNDGITNPTEDW